MSYCKTATTLFIAILLPLLSTWSYASGEAGLVEKMSKLQYFVHKTGLALKADNARLTGFYVHELEEMIEELEEFGQYKSYAIGKLIEDMLVPEFEHLEKQVKHGDSAAQWKAYNKLIESCNSCHNATAHGFIRVMFNSENPYPQSFEK